MDFADFVCMTFFITDKGDAKRIMHNTTAEFPIIVDETCVSSDPTMNIEAIKIRRVNFLC